MGQCAVHCELQPRMLSLYRMIGSKPHISVTKTCETRWEDLGPFIKAYLAVKDWEPSEKLEIKYSRSLKAYTKYLFCVVHGVPSLKLF